MPHNEVPQEMSLLGIFRLVLACTDSSSQTDTVTCECAQLFLKSQIPAALEIVLEPLMEQHSFTIVKKPQTATIFLQCIIVL